VTAGLRKLKERQYMIKPWFASVEASPGLERG